MTGGTVDLERHVDGVAAHGGCRGALPGGRPGRLDRRPFARASWSALTTGVVTSSNSMHEPPALHGRAIGGGGGDAPPPDGQLHVLVHRPVLHVHLDLHGIDQRLLVDIRRPGLRAAALPASHTYAAGNTYTVTLTVTGPGGSDCGSQPVTVTAPPSGGFTLSARGYKVRACSRRPISPGAGRGRRASTSTATTSTIATTSNERLPHRQHRRQGRAARHLPRLQRRHVGLLEQQSPSSF